MRKKPKIPTSKKRDKQAVISTLQRDIAEIMKRMAPKKKPARSMK